MNRSFGLIGYPLEHSRSAEYFNDRFRSEGISDAEYHLYPMQDLSLLPEWLERRPGLCGFNVTIPHKQRILPFLSGLDPDAREIGSVNVVLVSRPQGHPVLTGYNTDAPAFLSTLPEPFTHRRALILGTGGASRSVAFALRKLSVGITFVSRYPRSPDAVSYRDLYKHPAIVEDHTLIVNTTPVGMYPLTGGCPDLPYHLLGSRHLLYDLVYNPEQTRFLSNGAEYKAQTRSGLAMFLKQAELSYHLFATISLA